METRIEAVNSVIKKLIIELSPDDVRKPYQEAVRELKQTANVPGFRRGKAPEQLIRTRFRKELEGEMIRFVSRERYPEAVQKHAEELGPVILENMVDFKLQPDLALKTEFYLESLPVFEIQPLDNVTLTVPLRETDLDARTEEVLHDLRERMARFKPLQKDVAESGDYVEVSLTGTDSDGHTLLNNENLDLQLKEDGYFAPIVPSLIGMKPDEEKSFTVTYPDDDAFGDLKGRKLQIAAKLLQIKEREVPEANDDFARELGRFDTLDELKADIRKNLEKRHLQIVREDRERAIMEHLRDTHEFEVPPSLVHEEARSLTEAYFKQMAQYGIPFQQDEDSIRAVFELQQEEAEKRVRESILLSRIADQQNIQPEDADIDAILEEYIQNQGNDIPLDTLRKGLEEQGEMDRIRSIARQRKTFDFLLAQVTFEEKEPEEVKEEKKPESKKSKKKATQKKPDTSSSKSKNKEPETEDSHADSDGN